MIEQLAGGGPDTNWQDYRINVDNSRPVRDIAAQLTRRICSNLQNQNQN